MAIVRQSLDQFLSRVRTEGPVVKFTWLIGAGMSVSSGIGTAKDISNQLVLFEYMASNNAAPPWRKNKSHITYDKDLADYLQWYQYEESLDKWLEDAYSWLSTKKEFESINRDSSVLYPRLFDEFFNNETVSTTFLSNIIRRAKGVNLSHIGLAGLLRDYNKWGHTVFTTNFDDLLLTALISLNSIGRVFGDLKSQDTCETEPRFPQVVHLHGRHTGYRLANSKEQIKRLDQVSPEMKISFTTHLKTSNLIVLGYSGWDDLVMNILKEWSYERDFIKGNVYWIPYGSIDSMLPQTRKFLENDCPDGRVVVVEDFNESSGDYNTPPLDADRFILELCDVINYERGGFSQYRQEILQHAKKQHDFTLGQLTNYEEYDPNRAIDFARKAMSYVGKSDEVVSEYVNRALELVNIKDIPKLLLGKTLLIVSEVLYASGKLDEAISILNGDTGSVVSGVIETWERISPSEEIKYECIGYSYMLLAECYLEKGLHKEANETAKSAIHVVTEKASDNEKLYADLKVLLARLSLREGRVARLDKYLGEAEEAYRNEKDKYGYTLCQKLRGDGALSKMKIAQANTYYEDCISLCEELGFNDLKETTMRSLAFLRSYNESNLDEIEQEIRGIEGGSDSQKKDLLDGYLNSLKGSILLKRERYREALDCLTKAKSIFNEKCCDHDLANILGDILCCVRPSEIDITDIEVSNIKNELHSLIKRTKNGYAEYQMKYYEDNLESAYLNYVGTSSSKQSNEALVEYDPTTW